MIDMEKSHSAAYAAAGVDITAGYKGVKLMSADVKRTHIPGVVSCPRSDRYDGAGAGLRHRRRGHQTASG